MKKYDWNLEKIKEAVKESINFTEVLEKLNIPRQGNNTNTLKGILEKENIDYSHFTGRARSYAKPGQKNLEYYLTNQGKIKTSQLKEKLFDAGLKIKKCERCGITEWNGLPIVLQLHHIDGNNSNNNLNNLQILCPNCHSQTDNYCGSANKTNQIKYYCPDCGREITKDAKHCVICARKYHQDNISKCPSLETLVSDFLEFRSFTDIGKKYEVSDNAVKKWFVKLGLPRYKKELLEYLKNNTIEDIKKQCEDYLNDKSSKESLVKTNTFKYDNDLILKLIKLKYSTEEISNYIGCSKELVKHIGSKNQCSIRKSNVIPIACFKENVLIKYFFGAKNVAEWLINNYNYNKYTSRSLTDKISKEAKQFISILDFTFKYQNLPEISTIIENPQILEHLL